LGFNQKISFPDIDLREGETFDGWYTDAEFTSALVDTKKVKTPKEPVDVHFYGKFTEPKQDENESHNDPQEQNGGALQNQNQEPPASGSATSPSEGDTENK
jgi:uncharacterized repeat protein (TIGR02543 family)